MNRRDFIATVCVGTATGLAGCGGQDGGTPTLTDGNGEASTPTAAAPSTDADTPANATGGGGTPASSSVTIGDVGLQSADSYRMRIEVDGYQGMQGSAVYEGRWHSGDYAMTLTGQTASGVFYYVDGTNYLVSGGECVPMQGQEGQINTGPVEDSSDESERLQEWADVTATGTDTIDGEEVYVFEVDPEGRSIDRAYTYYVSTETGYLRRVETEGLVADYWDWGSAPPVEAPC